MLRSRRPGSFLALLLLGPAAMTDALGQAPIDVEAALLETTAEAPPVYIVEFLIFAYNDFSGREEEFSPATPHWPKALRDVAQRAAPETLQPNSAAWYLDDVLQPQEPVPAGPDVAILPAVAPPSAPALDPTPGSEAQPDEMATARSSHWYRLLEPDELELDRAFARLRALGAYTPLVHAGWSQATLLEDEAVPFELAWLGRLQPAGSIRLHRSRFLHLTLDISLQDSYRYRQSAPPAGSPWPLADFVGPVQYRIDTQRRVRTGELHFFDHPAFGVLIMVRPAPVDPAATGGATPGPAA